MLTGTQNKKANYGIDAPAVVWGLFACSIFIFILTPLTLLIQSAMWFWIAFICFLLWGSSFFVTGCWMIYGIFRTKPALAKKMIDSLNLTGDEKVLDLGCGRGLLLIEAAKKLSNGKAIGIDLWQTKDQSGNCCSATKQNANLEGVANQIEIHTGDIRSLPFPDHSFDSVVSSLAIHNIPGKEEREKALLEMLRVLKPEGTWSLMDIQFGDQYREFLQTQNTCSPITVHKYYSYCPPVTILSGKKL